MISIYPPLQAFFNSRPQQMYCADLYTISIRLGPMAPVSAVYYYTSSLFPITLGLGTPSSPRITWQPGPPYFKRGTLTCETGLTSNDSDLTVSFDQTAMIGGVLVSVLMAQGYFNSAFVFQERAYSPTPFTGWIGTVPRFSGSASSFSDLGETSVTMRVKALTELLNSDFPRNTIQASCNKILYQQDCGAARAPVTRTGSVVSGTRNGVTVTYNQPTSIQFASGVLTWTSGKMNGISYWVKMSLAGGVLQMQSPMLYIPQPGDTFSIVPGCDKTLATCTNTFNNAPNWGGMPFVPQPTVMY
jgi:hypothetical protein